MATKSTTVSVDNIYKSTDDCSLISFRLPRDLQEEWQFKPGQFINLKTEIDGKTYIRSYSLCCSPGQDAWQIGVKRIPGGLVSNWLNEELKTQDQLEISEPLGRFYLQPEELKKGGLYSAFAAGSGITPIYSMIKSHLAQYPDLSFQLFYVNRKSSSVILLEELMALKNKYMERFQVFHFLTAEDRGMELFNGRLDSEKLDKMLGKLIHPEKTNGYMCCGPQALSESIRDYLMERGVEDSKIHMELFFSESKTPAVQQQVEELVAEDWAEITMIEGNQKRQFRMPKSSTFILDEALQIKPDLPFACKGGVCCTCKAKVLEGEVDMLNNYALEDDEVEAGYVLTCQSQVLSDKLILDFDA